MTTKTIIPADKPLLVWHFLRQNWETNSGSIKTKVGDTYHVEPPIKICSNGMHGSRKVLDALGHLAGPILTLCEVWGEFAEQSDKIVAEYRRPLWGKDISTELNEWACCNAEVALLVAEIEDSRCWEAIEAKRAWLRGEISDKELDAAWHAAWLAARDSVGAAAQDADRDAAWDSAWLAAWHAAWAAVGAAARDSAWLEARDLAWLAARAAVGAAARDADRDAAWDSARAAQNADIENRILDILPSDLRARYLESRA